MGKAHFNNSGSPAIAICNSPSKYGGLTDGIVAILFLRIVVRSEMFFSGSTGGGCAKVAGKASPKRKRAALNNRPNSMRKTEASRTTTSARGASKARVGHFSATCLPVGS
jgi:hypothetical protein